MSSTSLEAAEIKFKLAELLDSLADAKMEMANIKEMVLEKETKIQELEKQINTTKSVIWEQPYYFCVLESGEKDGPFCQNCYDSTKELIRLQSPQGRGLWVCGTCKNSYKDSSYKGISGVRLERG